MSAYVFDGRRCHVCLFRRDEYRHLKVCVPQRYWPPQSEWADFRPVVEKTPKTVGKYPYEVYAQAFSTVLGQPKAYKAPEGVSNQMIYVEPEPWPSPAETWGEPVRISHGEEIVIGPYERPAPYVPTHGASTQAHISSDGTVTVTSDISGPVCDVCGRIFKHNGALTGHKRSHREVTA